MTAWVNGDVIEPENRQLSVITVGQPYAVSSMIVSISSANAIFATMSPTRERSLSDLRSIVMSTLTTRRVPTGPRPAEGKKVSQVAEVRQLTNRRYLVEVSETELALIKAALEQTERVARLGIEVLEQTHRAADSRQVENIRLSREVQALALRGASLRSLRTALAEAEPGEKVA